jgi:hypothetical protein
MLSVFLVFAAALPASAGTATGTTTLLGLPTAGTAVNVQVSVVSDIPVVPYEYAIQNECYFSGRISGHYDSLQRDDIVNWIYSSPPPNGSVPVAIMTVYLNSVPTGAACRVYLMKGGTLVKGSTTSYTVLP